LTVGLVRHDRVSYLDDWTEACGLRVQIDGRTEHLGTPVGLVSSVVVAVATDGGGGASQ
jgi:hypothetical protein